MSVEIFKHVRIHKYKSIDNHMVFSTIPPFSLHAAVVSNFQFIFAQQPESSIFVIAQLATAFLLLLLRNLHMQTLDK